VIIQSVAEMKATGQALAVSLRAGDLILLSGPLGAGKTALTQGIAEYLGIPGVTSPTFVISRIHEAGIKGIPLVHIDAYRLQDGDGSALFDDLDLIDHIERSITVVEWGEGLVDRIADQYLEIKLTHTKDENTRELTFVGHGNRWNGLSL
jgi:tRNA threonylcarbamoyladenosine biosynthesis protein TsaE